MVVARLLVVKGGGGTSLSPMNPKSAQLKGSALPPVVSCELVSWHLFIASCSAVRQSALLNLTWPALQLVSCVLMVDQSSMRTPALFHQYFLRAEGLAVMAGYRVPSKAEQYSLKCWSASEMWNFTCPTSWQVKDSLGARGAPPVINGNSDDDEVLDCGGMAILERIEVKYDVAARVPVPVGLEPPPPVVVFAAAEDNPPTDAVTDELDPVANCPQLSPAHERP